jgi:hypothetical protein
MVEPTEPPTEEHQSQKPMHRGDTDDTPDHHDWWDDTDVSGLIDPEAFSCFLYSYDQLLEDSYSDGDDDETIPRASCINIKSSLDRQPEPGRSPLMKQ